MTPIPRNARRRVARCSLSNYPPYSNAPLNFPGRASQGARTTAPERKVLGGRRTCSCTSAMGGSPEIQASTVICSFSARGTANWNKDGGEALQTKSRASSSLKTSIAGADPG